jgi:RHS repeat-associated protein
VSGRGYEVNHDPGYPGSNYSDNMTNYYHGDHLGSSRLMTSVNGYPVWQATFLPFGQEWTPEASGPPSPNHFKFTGKERDTESNLDFFGARYFTSNNGRFMSPDAPFVDQHVDDAQSWNLYAYARNNPLIYIDPTGEAIELTGKTEEDRKKELEAIKQSLVNSKVADKLYINPEIGKDGKETGRYFVGIQGDAKEFAKAGDLEGSLAEAIGSEGIVQFGLGEKVTEKQDWLDWLLSPATKDVGYAYGGGVTLRSNASLSGHAQVVVDPNDIRDRIREAPKPTLGEAVAHELLGHGLAFLRNPGIQGSRTNRLAVDQENRARARGGPQRGQRTTHAGGFPE